MKYLILALILLAQLASTRSARADDLPPLFVDLFLPSIHKQLVPIDFPPCVIDGEKVRIVCQ